MQGTCHDDVMMKLMYDVIPPETLEQPNHAAPEHRELTSRLHSNRRRVDPGSYLFTPPTDPDVQISRIRLLKLRIRCAAV
jgi:hypothetical protein